MSRRSKKHHRPTGNSRPSFFDQVSDDLRRNPPSIWRGKNKSIWPFILAAVGLMLWKMFHYR